MSKHSFRHICCFFGKALTKTRHEIIFTMIQPSELVFLQTCRYDLLDVSSSALTLTLHLLLQDGEELELLTKTNTDSESEEESV